MDVIPLFARHAGESPSAGRGVAINAGRFGATARRGDQSVHGEDYHTFGPPPLALPQTFRTRLDLEIVCDDAELIR